MFIATTLEILTYDEQGELIGALVATPHEDHIRIEADFDDGYASIALSLGPVEESVENLQSDLDSAVVATRVSEVFALVSDTVALPEPGPLATPSRKQCMMAFAVVVGTCGIAALNPANIFIGWGCVSGFAKSMCDCGEYLPINIC
jgi:hypothetical protein